MLFDTHCHLDLEAFDVDRNDVFERARISGITRFLNPSFDMASSRRSVQMAGLEPAIVSAIGIHPNDIVELTEAAISELTDLAQSKSVVAIGEIGLDYFWNKFPKQDQAAAFVQQLDLASSLKLPVIIHCRDAYNDTLTILEQYTPALKVLLHSFAGNQVDAIRAIKNGWYIGIGGPVTYKNAVTLRTIVADLPVNRIVLETDAPYLAPHPNRGKRNEPAFLRITASRVAELLHMELGQLANITSTNACAFFGLT